MTDQELLPVIQRGESPVTLAGSAALGSVCLVVIVRRGG